MIKIPNALIQSLANISNYCQTFLSSSCFLSCSQNEAKQPPIQAELVFDENKNNSRTNHSNQLSEQISPTPSQILSIKTSTEQNNCQKNDLKNDLNLQQLLNFKGEKGEIEALEELGEIEKELIAKYRPLEMSRSETRQLSKIDTKSQNTNR